MCGSCEVGVTPLAAFSENPHCEMLQTDHTPYIMPLPEWLETPVWSDYISKADSAQLNRQASGPEQIWGAASQLNEQIVVETKPTHTTDVHGGVASENLIHTWPVVTVAIATLCLYCYVLYRFRRDITTAIKNIGHTKDMLTYMEEQGADLVHFLRQGMLLFTLNISLILLAWPRFGAMQWLPPGYLVAGAVGVGGLLILYVALMMRLIGLISGDRRQMQELQFISSVELSMSALVFSPMALVMALSGRFFLFGLLLFLVVYIFHIITLYKYFAMSTFSKFQLILYLCTVEILPVSYILAMAVRESVI